ncbi:MAG TPA: ABC transporter ATP-binding protein [Conexibacter sp.]|nr:ABC transporter ATP-binding protein [Conexibacter sp.]
MLEIQELTKTYATSGGGTQAIAQLDFSVEESEFVSVVGPSGCGKTTLLKCISGLMRPSGGRAQLHGREIDGPPEELAIVFQNYGQSLFPWLTVRKNVRLPLRRKRRAQEADAAVEEALAAVGLASFGEHYPWQLSGGMQQRVAIARALAYRPSILLLDEPFASVDAQTRTDLEDLVLQVRRAFGVTVLLVTHDIDEAVYMSDRIVILSKQPSTVIETLAVELPNPRDQIATKELAEFAHLRAHVYRAIMRAHEPVPV